MTETSYVYKWTHLPTLQWYVGVRYAKGCHIDDGYICSSKTVKPRILGNPEEWSREIIEVGSKVDMTDLELEILQMFQNNKDSRCLNRNKVNHPPTFSGEDHPMFGTKASDETRAKQSLAKRIFFSNPENRARITAIRRSLGLKLRGLPKPTTHSKETCEKISATIRADPVAMERARQLSINQKGKPNLPLCRPIAGTSCKGDEETLYFVSAGDACKYGFYQASIQKCCSGKSKTHYNRTWRYLSNDEIKQHFPEHYDRIFCRPRHWMAQCRDSSNIQL